MGKASVRGREVRVGSLWGEALRGDSGGENRDFRTVILSGQALSDDSIRDKGRDDVSDGRSRLLLALAVFLAEVDLAQNAATRAVTSSSSSSSMYSRHSSSDISRGGARLTLSSRPDARMFVSFLVRQNVELEVAELVVLTDDHALVDPRHRA